MCIIIYKPKEAIVPAETLVTCWNNNNDGAGFMFPENGHLAIKKGMMEFNHFISEYRPVEEMNVPMVIHFRIKTHGVTAPKNTHPFYVFPGILGFAHNGIFSQFSTHRYLSDTQLFNNKVLKQLPRNFLMNDAIMMLMDRVIGFNRLAFMDNQGSVWILNESLGYYDKAGIWYSNETYLHDYSCEVFYRRKGKNSDTEFDTGLPDQFFDDYYCTECCTFFGDDEAWDYSQVYPSCPTCGSAVVFSEFDAEDMRRRRVTVEDMTKPVEDSEARIDSDIIPF